VVGAGVAAKTLAVAADPNLPSRTAAQLLVDLQTASLDGLSGTVVERADLGLPAIPLLTGDKSNKLTSLVSGKHTLRVWYSGPDKARVSLLGTQGQSDVIHNGTDTWIWDSQSGEAQHFAGSAEGKGKDGKPGAIPTPTDLPKSPQEAADLALKAIDPTTAVSTGNTAKIAGRDAYELILRPRDNSTLVSEVRLAIDAKEKLPLRVQVLARGTAEPAFEVAFTQVNFARPDDAEFKFNPPAGTKVTEADPAKAAEKAEEQQKQHSDDSADKPKSTVVGTGWASVFVIRTSDAKGADSEEAKKAQDAIGQLPTGIGGRTFNSKLVSVLFTDDGRVLVGSVTPEKLAQVAKDPAAALK